MPLAVIAILPIIAITLVGDYYIKLAAEGRGLGSPKFYGGAALYATSAIGFLIAMRHMSLAAVGVWYSVLTILAMTALGVMVFGERLMPREMLGILLAFASLVCMSRFT